MEYSEEFINEFKKQREEDRLKRIQSENLTNEIRQSFFEGKITSLQAFWHTNISDCDWNLQPHKLDFQVSNGNLAIITNVSLEKLIDHLVPYQKKMFKERQLFNGSLDDTNTAKIINHWLHSERLIPPTILIVDEKFPNPAGNIQIEFNDEFHPVDGKHRLNVANYFGTASIPIVVIERQEQKIRDIFSM
ncbi:hypothetical protein ACR788_15445 [Sphingobacterium siyangense]|uniref:hypothetical protein n=1 Tax=Sphingobacterium siyangense TaxID=459529 RepID=UPI003DA26DE8